MKLVFEPIQKMENSSKITGIFIWKLELEREETDLPSVGSLSPLNRRLQMSVLSQPKHKPGVSSFIQVSPMDAGATIHGFPQAISRELDWKQNDQGMNWNPYGMPHCMRQLHLLSHHFPSLHRKLVKKNKN